MVSNNRPWRGPTVRLMPARDEAVAFFLLFSLYARSLPLMEDFPSSQTYWRSLCLAGAIGRTEARREYMPTEIRREEVCRMVEDGAQLVEVLPTEEYEAEHLPGAINLPLQQLDRQSAVVLQQDRPVIVYCYDSQ
jgi:Rhodanese-like domain